MAQIQAGDTAQMAHLFERHHLGLFRYLCRLTRNQALSEDLTQEVFLRALKYASSYNPSYSFRSWLYAMAHNACHDSRRKVRGEVADVNLKEFHSAAPLAEDEVDREQHVRLLAAAMNRLPAEKREVLELSRFQDMRYDEIAAVMKCEVGTVKVRVFRAMKELRERFLELQGRQVA